jgi:glycosyltransferase involved in cell wall biosynthesis
MERPETTVCADSVRETGSARPLAVIVTNIPRPYRIALFNEISRVLDARGADLHVVFVSRTSSHRARRSVLVDLDGLDCAWSSPAGVDFPLRDGLVLTFPASLQRHLTALSPAVVVCGGFSLPSMAVMRFARRGGVPFLIWSGEVPWAKTAKSIVRLPVRRMLCRRATGFVTYSTPAAKYLAETFSVDAERITVAPNAVDDAWFAAKADEYHAGASARRDLDAPVELMYAGRLVRSKGVHHLIAACASLPGAGQRWRLRLYGEGRDESEFRRLADSLGVADSVDFLGFQQAEQLARAFADADVFVLPTLFDTWGLVVNEAMACGLPCVVSPYAAVAHDLIDDCVDGFIVDPQDEQALSRVLDRLVEDGSTRVRVGAHARTSVVQRASLGLCASRFAAAILGALGRAGRTWIPDGGASAS